MQEATERNITEKEAWAAVGALRMNVTHFAFPRHCWTATCLINQRRRFCYAVGEGDTPLRAIEAALCGVGAEWENKKTVAEFMRRPGIQNGLAKVDALEQIADCGMEARR